MTQAATNLEHARERFIAIWGQMGSNWGIPRAMAETHALLYVVGEPMNTDQVIDALGISRGSASMTLRSLVEWGIVRRVHRRGDRKDYYHAEQDVWKMFRTILRERKKREIDPLLEDLHACHELTSPGQRGHRIGPDARALDAHNERLARLVEFIQIVDSIGQRFVSPSGKGLQLAAKLLSKAS